jgi:capsular exopolysaccharide synthesis family protein
VAIESELAQLQERKANEAKRIVTSLRNQYKLALARERSLKASMENQKQESLELNKKAIQYRVLQRQAESSKHMYDLLIQRFKETSLVEEMKTGNIRIIDQAQAPSSPFSPDVRRGVLLSVVLGLFLGVGLAFLLEYLDNTIKFPEEIKDHLGLSYIGMIPAFDVREKLEGVDSQLITMHSANSPPSEAFRAVRTGILFSLPDVNIQILWVGSSAPGEGKTLSTANLAVTMAQAGSRTLVIDCDLRRPNMHNLFGTEKETGLTSIVSGSVEPREAIVETGIENLAFLPGGPKPPNPSEVLGSNRMIKLLERLRTKYDRIILDTPPVSAVTDAVVLAPRADGCLLVVRGGVTPRKVVQSAIEKLRMVDARMIGAVMNAVDVKRAGYYYHKYHYYYEHYGYGMDDGGKRRKKRGGRMLG